MCVSQHTVLIAQVPVWTLAVTAGGVMLVLLLGLCLARCTRRRPDSCALTAPLRTPPTIHGKNMPESDILHCCSPNSSQHVASPHDDWLQTRANCR